MSLYEVPAVEALPFYVNNRTAPEDDSLHTSIRRERRRVADENSNDDGADESTVDDDGADESTVDDDDNDLARSQHSSSSSSTSTSTFESRGRKTPQQQQQNIAPDESTNDDTTNDSNGNDNDNDNNTDTGCPYSTVIIPIEELPSLPVPKNEMIREETSRGLCAVITCSVLLPMLTHYVALTLILPDDDDDDNSYQIARIIFLSLIYTESFLALVCMFGILNADPCVVHRSPETCFPLPLAVESWVIGHNNNDSEEERQRPPRESYIKGNGDQGVYCTKCLVWRKPGINHFHCAICQRCCAYHDHHCGVFGRCIAGRKNFWTKSEYGNGNLMFFVTLIAMAGWAYFTMFSAFIYAFSMRFGPKYAVPIGLVAMLMISCCCFNNSPMNVVCWPVCRLFVFMRNLVRWCYRRCLCIKNSTKCQRQEASHE